MDTFVDVAFPLKGKTVSLDHGYALFGALSRRVPAIHHEETWGVFPVHGKKTGRGELTLLPSSHVTIRLPGSRIAELLQLSNEKLDVGGHEVSLGIPRVFPLQPRPALLSRFVTIKKFHEEPGPFAEAVRRQLDACEVGANAQIAVGSRRVIRVSSHTIVGFQVGLSGLSADESIRVQTRGVGGRRHIGAGLFLPVGKTA